MTTTKKTTATKTVPVDETVEKNGNFVLKTLRGGMGALESATMSVAEFPLTALSGLGVPKGATDAARNGSRTMLHGVNGTIDTLATQTFKIAGKGASLVTGAVGVGK